MVKAARLESRRSCVRAPLWHSSFLFTRKDSLFWGAFVAERYRARPQTTSVEFQILCLESSVISFISAFWGGLAYMCTKVASTPIHSFTAWGIVPVLYTVRPFHADIGWVCPLFVNDFASRSSLVVKPIKSPGFLFRAVDQLRPNRCGSAYNPPIKTLSQCWPGFWRRPANTEPAPFLRGEKRDQLRWPHKSRDQFISLISSMFAFLSASYLYFWAPPCDLVTSQGNRMCLHSYARVFFRKTSQYSLTRIVPK